jgi:hypothetical protein
MLCIDNIGEEIVWKAAIWWPGVEQKTTDVLTNVLDYDLMPDLCVGSIQYLDPSVKDLFYSNECDGSPKIQCVA